MFYILLGEYANQVHCVIIEKKSEVHFLNKKVGFRASIFMTAMVLLFALGMVIGINSVSYFVCMLLSWAFVIVVCSFAGNVSADRKVYAYGAIAFACIYAVLIDIVYFTQLTTVAYQAASPEVLKVLSYEVIGSWMFNLDLFGYGMMAISTLLIGLTIISKNRYIKWLKALLMVHGVFVISCVLFPMLNVFNADMTGGAIYGTIALLFWCAYFTPIGVLSAVYFKKQP